MPITA
jgi:hypothetical protein